MRQPSTSEGDAVTIQSHGLGIIPTSFAYEMHAVIIRPPIRNLIQTLPFPTETRMILACIIVAFTKYWGGSIFVNDRRPHIYQCNITKTIFLTLCSSFKVVNHKFVGIMWWIIPSNFWFCIRQNHCCWVGPNKANGPFLSTKWVDYVEEPMKYQALRPHFFSMGGWWGVVCWWGMLWVVDEGWVVSDAPMMGGTWCPHAIFVLGKKLCIWLER